MARLTDQEIDEIARRIAADIARGGSSNPPAPGGLENPPHMDIPQGLGVFTTVEEAVRAAKAAQPVFAKLKLEQRSRISIFRRKLQCRPISCQSMLSGCGTA